MKTLEERKAEISKELAYINFLEKNHNWYYQIKAKHAREYSRFMEGGQ